ncbi:MAG TPA: PAS domain-containing protein, partial [Candidatus Sulfotelmatobacter sp.]|nr:PAS domain-containing protein [Candidatus Sulfotelmatobacter sp.]
DTSPDSIYFKDSQLRFIRVSRATAQVEGIQNPDDLIGKTDFDLYPRETAQKYYDEEMEIMRTGQAVINREESTQRPDQPRKFFLDTEVPLRDSSGQVIGLFAVSRDITDFKLVEQELARERDLMRALMDTSPDSIYFKDAQLRFLRVSRSTAQIEGFHDPEELLGKTDFDLYPRETAQKYFDAEMEIIRTEQPVVNREEKAHPRPGQPAKWVLYTEAPLRDAAGQVIGVYAIAKDVTARKLAELALQHERDLMKALMDTSPISIYFKDTQLRFVRASRAAALREGVLDPELMVGKTDFDFYDQKTAQEFFDLEMELIRTGQAIINREGEGHRPGKSPGWFSFSKIPLTDAAGQVIGLFGISTDITDRKKVELELERERNLMRALMDNVPDAIYFKDAQLRFMRANKAAALKEGVQQPEEMTGKTDFDYYARESAQEYYDLEMEIMRTGRPVID